MVIKNITWERCPLLNMSSTGEGRALENVQAWEEKVPGMEIRKQKNDEEGNCAVKKVLNGRGGWRGEKYKRENLKQFYN